MNILIVLRVCVWFWSVFEALAIRNRRDRGEVFVVSEVQGYQKYNSSMTQTAKVLSSSFWGEH